MGLLATLIANRGAPINNETVQALNMIDVIFSKKKQVRKLWHEYFDMLNNEGLKNESGFALQRKKNLELITEAARVLRFGKAITHLDMDRVYRPVGFWEQVHWSQDFQTELLRVLRATARLQVDLQVPIQHPSPGGASGGG
jgi:galactokinase